MRRMMKLGIRHFGYAAAVVGVLSGGSAIAQTMVMFQQGVNGYTDGFHMRISEQPPPAPPGVDRDGVIGNNVNGSYIVDGFQVDDPLTPAIEARSFDEQDLMRFDNIFGAGAGQIPLGATILDAQLTLKTGLGSNDPSGGPFGVARLLQPFTPATRYEDFVSTEGNPILPSRGAWFQDGYATRPSGGFAGPNSPGPPATGTNTATGINNADVFPLIQAMSDGAPNNGFVIQAGFIPVTTNGWGYFTNGRSVVEDRPKLSVTYTEDPIEVNVFQRDLNGYTGDTVARPSSGANLTDSADDVTTDGSITTTTLGVDTVDPSASTDARNRMLLQFDNVFGAGEGQAPDDKEVAKAWLVMTTGTGGEHGSPGPFSVHPMLREWDVNSLYTNFGATPGFQEADGDIGPALDTQYGMIDGAEAWLDVTTYLEGVRNGATDNGLVLVANTGNGWFTFVNGATDVSVRPRLVVYSNLSADPGLEGDHNGDGIVDAADYVAWRKSPGDFGGDPGGYNAFRENFGEGGPGGGGAVPEPATWLLGLVACAAIAAVRKR